MDQIDKTWKSLDELEKSINELDDILGRVPDPFKKPKYTEEQMFDIIFGGVMKPKKPKLTLIKGGKK